MTYKMNFVCTLGRYKGRHLRVVGVCRDSKPLQHWTLQRTTSQLQRQQIPHRLLLLPTGTSSTSSAASWWWYSLQNMFHCASISTIRFLILLNIDPCTIEAHMRPLLSRCLVSYSKKSEDKTDYFPNWMTIDNHTMSPDTNTAHLDAFRYQSQSQLKGKINSFSFL